MGVLKQTLDHYGLKEEDIWPRARSQSKVHFDLEPSIISTPAGTKSKSPARVQIPPVMPEPLPPQMEWKESTESSSISSIESNEGIPSRNYPLIEIPRQIAFPPVRDTAHQRATPPRLDSQPERYTPHIQTTAAHSPPSLALQKPLFSPFSVGYYLSGVILSSISALVGAVLLSFAPWNRNPRKHAKLKVSQKSERRHARDWNIGHEIF